VNIKQLQVDRTQHTGNIAYRRHWSVESSDWLRSPSIPKNNERYSLNIVFWGQRKSDLNE